MNRLAAFLLILIPSLGFSWEDRMEAMPTCMLTKSEKDDQLTRKESVYVFTFNGITDWFNKRTMRYSIDGKEGIASLTDDLLFEINTTPGKHVFQFYYNQNYAEVETSALEIKPQYRDEYTIYFENITEPRAVKKPIIYLYPEVEMEIKVRVKPAGEMVFTYPTTTDQWTVRAKPSGEIEYDGESYNYLFWEADQTIKEAWLEGFALEQNEIVGFLENSLNQFGFNAKERTDFITFWGPQMLKHPGCLVHFVMNDDCRQFADLAITPRPDGLYRFYMIWAPVDNVYDYAYLRPQNIQTISRLGFTVLEWGGVEMDKIPAKLEAL